MSMSTSSMRDLTFFSCCGDVPFAELLRDRCSVKPGRNDCASTSETSRTNLNNSKSTQAVGEEEVEEVVVRHARHGRMKRSAVHTDSQASDFPPFRFVRVRSTIRQVLLFKFSSPSNCDLLELTREDADKYPAYESIPWKLRGLWPWCVVELRTTVHCLTLV